MTTVDELLNKTFYCQRFHCNLFTERCIQRQKSNNPEIYEGCTNCKQGKKNAQKAGAKIGPYKPSRFRIIPLKSCNTTGECNSTSKG